MEVAGVFWDIENCAVPHQKSAFALVQRIRERMFQHLREVEFMCACDAGKETKAVMDELNSAQGKYIYITKIINFNFLPSDDFLVSHFSGY